MIGHIDRNPPRFVLVEQLGGFYETAGSDGRASNA